jgi:hypothetical protein
VFGISVSLFGAKEINRFTSPSGDNEIVILEGGFIDAYYYAYPVKYKWFYQSQKNGFVSKHDNWGEAKIESEVEWIDKNTAIVTIIIIGFDIPNSGTNPNDKILVTFDPV